MSARTPRTARPDRGRRPAPGLVATAATAALALALALAGCGSGEDTGGAPSSATQAPATQAPAGGDAPAATAPPADPTAPPPPEVTGVQVGGLDNPVALLPRPGDDHLWGAERTGAIRRLAVGDDGSTLTVVGEAALDLSDQTVAEGERGLLDIAFSAAGDELYVSYTDLAGDTRLVAYALQGDVADPDSRRVLLAEDQPYPNHNGGNVELGPDGLLWFGFGDGGASDDPENRAQDPDTVLGKIVRLDPAAPEGTEPEIVVSGARNPWRFSFDVDGSLWVADVGQNQWEEINRLPADAIDGANLGWSAFEGTNPNPNVDPEGRQGTDPVPPVFEYSHENGNCSITGGFVYRGPGVPDLQGAYVFADYCAGRVRAVRLADDGTLAAEYDLGVDVPGAAAFGTDADGEAYVLSTNGSITRLVANG